ALVPEIAGDPSLASDLAGEMTMLRRQLPLARAREVLEDERRAAEDAQRARKKPWQFWKR
ncbi:hypothetical protein LCGC14_2435010, partial [marine sediment metagenome]